MRRFVHIIMKSLNIGVDLRSGRFASLKDWIIIIESHSWTLTRCGRQGRIPQTSRLSTVSITKPVAIVYKAILANVIQQISNDDWFI
jgi:hypothetical protein